MCGSLSTLQAHHLDKIMRMDVMKSTFFMHSPSKDQIVRKCRPLKSLSSNDNFIVDCSMRSIAGDEYASASCNFLNILCSISWKNFFVSARTRSISMRSDSVANSKGYIPRHQIMKENIKKKKPCPMSFLVSFGYSSTSALWKGWDQTRKNCDWRLTNNLSSDLGQNATRI